MRAAPLAPPAIAAVAQRGGTRLRVPRPVPMQDTREQNLFSVSRFQGWFASVERRPLKPGDYSVAGLEDVCAVERKALSDPVRSLTAERRMFVERGRRMGRCPQLLPVITAALSQVKCAHSPANPNGVAQALIAALAGWNVPFLCGEGEEVVASYLYQSLQCHRLESHDYGRCLADDDL